MVDRRWTVLLIAALWVLASAEPLRAQSQIPGSVPTQQFHPVPGGDNDYVSVSGADVLRHLQFSGGGYLNYGYRPLVLDSLIDDRSVAIVEHQLQADVLGAVGLYDRFELGVRAPLTLYQQSGDSPGLPGGTVDPIALGDIALYPKWRIGGIGDEASGAAFALVVPTSLPVGDDADLQGNASVTVTPRMVADLTLASGVRLAANLGYVIRPNRQQLMNLDIGHQFEFKAGYEQPLPVDDWTLLGEIYGKAGLDAKTGPTEPEDVPLELIAGGRWQPTENHSLTVGGGPGLSAGYGTPSVRLFVGYTYEQSATKDADGDGLIDRRDACPNEPEDEDGFEDGDGCPDPDNDGDGIEDEEDACPMTAEDEDGYRDADGCPDVDNDGDGLADADDRCPFQPEDFDGYEDGDGCPDLDKDGDGVTQLDDRCPAQPEDFDGYEDGDGCPDTDNDTDGIADREDHCPERAEVYNGVEDEDGCPDEGEEGVEVTSEEFVIKQKVYFETGSAKIRKKSHSILKQVAGEIRAHPDIPLVEIQGHTDARGDKEDNYELSQKRAEAVTAFLVEQGVDADRLQAIGYGESDPEVPNDSREAMSKNRRVEFIIHEEATEIWRPGLEGMKDRDPAIQRTQPSGSSTSGESTDDGGTTPAEESGGESSDGESDGGDDSDDLPSWFDE